MCFPPPPRKAKGSKEGKRFQGRQKDCLNHKWSLIRKKRLGRKPPMAHAIIKAYWYYCTFWFIRWFKRSCIVNRCFWIYQFLLYLHKTQLQWAWGARAPGVFFWLNFIYGSNNPFAFLETFCLPWNLLPSLGAEGSTSCFFIIDFNIISNYFFFFNFFLKKKLKNAIFKAF